MPETDAPSTFRRPISRVRCSAVKEASPSRPRHAMKTASIEKLRKMRPCRVSFR